MQVKGANHHLVPNVLFVGPDENRANAIRDQLTRAGLAVDWRGLPPAAPHFAATLQTGVDLVLIEGGISAGEGLEWLVAVRVVNATVPVVLVGGPADEVRVRDAIKAGADDYVSATALERLPAVVNGLRDAPAKSAGPAAAEDRRHAVFMALARSPVWQAGDENEVLREITEKMAEALEVERVSFWRFDPERRAIVCRDLFERSQARHQSGLELRESDYPAYFEALATSEIIPADEARRDRRTAEFTASYLEPLGITSMLDAPVLVGGRLEGVMCCEQVGPARNWTAAECGLALAAAGLAAQALTRFAKAASEARLRAILDNEPECVKLVSADGRLLDMNPAGLRMIEAEAGKVAFNRPVINLIHPEDRAAFLELHEQVVAGGSGRQQFRIIGLRGTERWMETHSTPLRDAQGAVASVLSITRDITEKRRSEQALRESEERHRMLFMNNPMPGWVYDLDTLRFLEVNDAAVAKYGYTREEFLGMTIRDIRPDEDVPALMKNVEKITSGLNASGIWRHRLKGGDIIQVEINSHVLDFGGHRAELVLANDVTRRLQAEAERQQAWERESAARQEAEAARRYYQSLFEYAPGSYLVLQGEDCRIVAVSEAYLQATMTQRDQIQGRGLFEVFPDMPDDQSADGVKNLRASLERVKALGRSDVMPVQRYPIRRPEAEGGGWEERFWSVVNTPVPGPDGGIAFIIHRAEDVTEFARARQQAGAAVTAEQAQKALDSQAKQIEADIVLRSFELKRANEELVRNQSLMRIAGRAARLGGWVLELPAERLIWSDETCRIHDLPAGHQPTLLEAISYYAPEHRRMVEESVKHSMDTGEPYQFESKLITAKGRHIWVRSSGEVLKNEHGGIQALQGAIQDITAIKDGEERLKREEGLLQLAGKIAKVAGWSVTVPEPRLYWSKHIWDLVDFPKDKYPTLDEVLPYYLPESRERLAQAIRRCAAEGADFDIETQIVTPSGREMWARVAGEAARDEHGTIVAVNGAFSDITDPKKTELEIRSLARRLTKTLESITDAFFTLDRDWRFVYLNPEAEHLLKRSKTELLGRNVWEEFPAAVGTDFERNYRRAMQEQATVHFDEFYPEPLNAWYEVRAYPSEEGLAVYFLDVTEQRRQEEILRASDERFRLLAKATNDAIWDWDLATDALWWNEGFETLFGFGRDEVEPTIESWTKRIHPEDRTAVETAVRRAIDGGAASWTDEYRFQRKDGTHAYVLDRGNIIRDADGRAVRMIGGMTDITERREIEERLREQASLLDAAHDAIMVRDIEHRILYLNRSSEALYGWSAAEMLGRPSRDLLYADRTAFDAAMQQLLADGQWSGEFTQVRRDGGMIEIESSWTLLRDAQQAPKSVLVINTDVTERKKLEQQFLRAQRMESIGTLAGGIAHDLNNLLAPIMMGVELLKQYQPAPASRQLIENIERSARRGADLVKQVLSFARGVEGSRVPVQLKHIVRDVEQILASTLPKNICVTCDHADNLWPVLGDPTQLNQVLLNLSVNARDAMPDGGQLTMTLSNREFDEHYAVMNRGVAAGRYVVVEVADTGCGIPREILDRIFDPFFTTKEVGKGTGLGLSTVQGIVRSHGGFINVYSEEGKGTTFRVGLPALTEESEDEGTRHPLCDRLPRGHGELILVVDDETSILQITKQTLEAFGYRVLTAEDGAQAVGVFALQPQAIALVLTDMMMPVMDGPALIAVLKRIRADVRIIASSGLNANGRVALAAGQGIRHFIPKPYSAETMLQKIKLALNDGNHAAL